MEPKKYEYIDSLRGIAILLVIIVHVGYIMEFTMQYFPQGLITFVFYCQYGVQLFFIVSAFTLTISHYNRKEEDKKNKKFFIRRFFRIAPLFYVAALFNAFNEIGWNFSNIGDISLLKLFTSFTFTSTLFPESVGGYVPGGWTISVEFLFYLILPLILLKVKSLNSSLVFVSLSYLLPALYIFFNVADKFYISYFTLLYQLPIFALGILAYWLLNDKERKVKGYTFLLLAATIFLSIYVDFPMHYIHGLVFVMLLLGLSIHSYKLLSNKITARVGLVSYSMYIVHFIVIGVFNKLKFTQIIEITNLTTSLINFVIMYLMVCTVTFIISSLTYKFIEVPGQNLGRKLIKRLNTSKS